MLRYDPSQHEIVETELARSMNSRMGSGSKFFTYHHKVHDTWVIAHWVGERVMEEVWASDPGIPRIEEAIPPGVARTVEEMVKRSAEIRRRIRAAGAEKDEEKRRKGLLMADARKDVAKTFRKRLERQGRLPGRSERFLERFEKGWYQWQPEL